MISREAARLRKAVLEQFPTCTVAVYPAELNCPELLSILVRPKSRLRQVRDFIEQTNIPEEIEIEIVV